MMKIPDMPHRGLGEGGTRSLRQIKEEYHRLLKSLSSPNIPEGVTILHLQELREEHNHLKKEQPENLELNRIGFLLQDIRDKIEGLDLNLEEDIARLEEKDPALGASLRRIKDAW